MKSPKMASSSILDLAFKQLEL